MEHENLLVNKKVRSVFTTPIRKVRYGTRKFASEHKGSVCYLLPQLSPIKQIYIE